MNSLRPMDVFQTTSTLLRQQINIKIVAITAIALLALGLVALAFSCRYLLDRALPYAVEEDTPKDVASQNWDKVNALARKELQEKKDSAAKEKETPVVKKLLPFSTPLEITRQSPVYYLEKAYHALNEIDDEMGDCCNSNTRWNPFPLSEIKNLNGLSLEDHLDSFVKIANTLNLARDSYLFAPSKKAKDDRQYYLQLKGKMDKQLESLEAVYARIAVVYFQRRDLYTFGPCLNLSGDKFSTLILRIAFASLAEENRLEECANILQHMSKAVKDTMYVEVAQLWCDKHEYGKALEVVKLAKPSPEQQALIEKIEANKTGEKR